MKVVCIRSTCINFGRDFVLAGGDRVALDEVGRVILDAVMAGLGSLDRLAYEATGGVGGALPWKESFEATASRSSILEVVSIAPDMWPDRSALVLDWAGACAPLRTRRGSYHVWKKAKRRNRHPELVFGAQSSLFEQIQVLRTILGTSDVGPLAIVGQESRCIFGDLVHLHNAVLCLDRQWPTARRAWHVDRDLLSEDLGWMDHLYYAFRHSGNGSENELSPASGSVLASQEVRAICDARVVYCWDEVQQRELREFYGKSADEAPLYPAPDSGGHSDARIIARAIRKELIA